MRKALYTTFAFIGLSFATFAQSASTVSADQFRDFAAQNQFIFFVDMSVTPDEVAMAADELKNFMTIDFDEERQMMKIVTVSGHPGVVREVKRALYFLNIEEVRIDGVIMPTSDFSEAYIENI